MDTEEEIGTLYVWKSFMINFVIHSVYIKNIEQVIF